MNSNHPVRLLEKFLTLLREKEEALDYFQRQFEPNGQAPAYVALLKESIEEVRLAAIAEVHGALHKDQDPEVTPGPTAHEQLIADAMEVIKNYKYDTSTRMDLITPHELTPRAGPLNGVTPADLVYVGRKLEVDVLSQNSKPVYPATVVIDDATRALCKGPNDPI